MSRNRKPLDQQSKHLTSAEINEKMYAQEQITVGKSQLERPPDELFYNEIALNEYMRVVKEFDKVEIVGNLDRQNLIGYANAYAISTEALHQLSESSLILNDGDKTFKNPLMTIHRQYAEEMRRFAKLCGLTIDSRLKVATYKTTEDKEKLNDEFGDI